MNKWIWLGLFLVTLGSAYLIFSNKKPVETKSPAAIGGPEDLIPAPQNPNNPTPLPPTPETGSPLGNGMPQANPQPQNTVPSPENTLPPSTNNFPTYDPNQNPQPIFPPNPADSFDPSTITPAPPFPDNPQPEDDFIPPPQPTQPFDGDD